MLKKVKDNFSKGIERIKWFSVVFAERFKIEIAIIKLLYQSDEMDKKKEELLKTVGQRVYELKKYADKNVFRDRVVVEALDEIETIEKNMDELKQKVAEIGSVRV